MFTERVVVALSECRGCLQSFLFSFSDQLGPCSTLNLSLARLPCGTALTFRAEARAYARRVPAPALLELLPLAGALGTVRAAPSLRCPPPRVGGSWCRPGEPGHRPVPVKTKTIGGRGQPNAASEARGRRTGWGEQPGVAATRQGPGAMRQAGTGCAGLSRRRG